MRVLLPHRRYRLSSGCEKKGALWDPRVRPTLWGAARRLQRRARLARFECGMVLLCAVVRMQSWCRLAASVPPPFRLLAQRLHGGL